jgi:hypothetical protein
LLDDLDLAFLEDLHALQALFHLVGRVGAAHQALALAAAALDDARLELVTPRVERLDALGHRVAHGDRGVDCVHHRRSGDPGKDRADEDDVDTEESGSGGRVDHDRSRFPLRSRS